MEYFVKKNGKILGPFEENKLKALLTQKKFSAENSISVDKNDWFTISECDIFDDIENSTVKKKQKVKKVKKSSPPPPPAPVSAVPPPPPPQKVNSYPDNVRPDSDNMEASQLASRGARFLAVMLDGLCFLPISIIYEFAKSSKNDGGMVIAGIAFLILSIVQIVLLSNSGQTIGKKLMGIKIVNIEDKSNPGFFGAVFLRKFVTGLLYIIPFFVFVDVLCIFRHDKRCIHDLIAGTEVVTVS